MVQKDAGISLFQSFTLIEKPGEGNQRGPRRSDLPTHRLKWLGEGTQLCIKVPFSNFANAKENLRTRPQLEFGGKVGTKNEQVLSL